MTSQPTDARPAAPWQRIAVLVCLAALAGVGVVHYCGFAAREAREIDKSVRKYSRYGDWELRRGLTGGLASVYHGCCEATPPSSRIFLADPDDRRYFLAVYYLYPREVVIGPHRVIKGEDVKQHRFEPTPAWLREQGIDYVLELSPDNRTGKIIPMETMGDD